MSVKPRSQSHTSGNTQKRDDSPRLPIPPKSIQPPEQDSVSLGWKVLKELFLEIPAQRRR